MIQGYKIAVVMPAYNAEATLEKTYNDIPKQYVDEIILVDDYSQDKTVELAKKLGIKHIIRLNKNSGYGANQKTCYQYALNLGADIIIMLHPDYQYPPQLIPAMVHLITSGLYKVVFASRILGKQALQGGMPIYKYIANRLLTFIQNIIMNQKMSEYHTGYRAYHREVLEKINFLANSDDFVFDNQIAAQILYAGYVIGEISCPTRYFPQASSINFIRSVKYGFGVLWTSLQYRLQKWKLAKFKIFETKQKPNNRG